MSLEALVRVSAFAVFAGTLAACTFVVPPSSRLDPDEEEVADEEEDEEEDAPAPAEKVTKKPAASKPAATGACTGVQASCTLTAVCTEYAAYSEAQIAEMKKGCTAASGTWATTPCSRASAFGGCAVRAAGSDLCAAQWYSAPYTEEAAKQACGSNSYLTP